MKWMVKLYCLLDISSWMSQRLPKRTHYFLLNSSLSSCLPPPFSFYFPPFLYPRPLPLCLRMALSLIWFHFLFITSTTSNSSISENSFFSWLCNLLFATLSAIFPSSNYHPLSSEQLFCCLHPCPLLTHSSLKKPEYDVCSV